MTEDTFGNPIEFPSLVAITDRMNSLPRNKKRYLASFLNDFSNFCNDMNNQDSKFKFYLTNLVKAEKFSRLDHLELEGIDPILISHIKCYITAKIRIIIKNKKS